MQNVQAKNIDEYIAAFPKDTQKLLKDLRATIKKAAPKAEEAIKYAIPTFVQGGNLVHFAAYKRHIGFYPSPGPIREFKKELAKYEQSKGAIRFPLDEPLPLTLITKIVKFRIQESAAKALAKQKKK